MLRKSGFLILALIGIAFAIFMIFWSRRTPPVPPVLFQPAQPIYRHYIAGEGIIESFNDNISVGTPFNEIVTELYVFVGTPIKKGSPLFKLDTRQFEADLIVAQKNLAVAQRAYESQKTIFDFYQKVSDASAVSKQDYTKMEYAMLQTEDQMKSVAAQIDQIKTNIERSTIKSPIDGVVLQRNIHLGEVATINPFNQLPLLLIGAGAPYQLRINIAEEDAWRVVKEAAATAYVRGNSALQIPLKFHHVEPFVVAKQVLTGADVERVDTRVLQLVYLFDPKDLPIYMGQLLDVYIEARPSKI